MSSAVGKTAPRGTMCGTMDLVIMTMDLAVLLSAPEELHKLITLLKNNTLFFISHNNYTKISLNFLLE